MLKGLWIPGLLAGILAAQGCSRGEAVAISSENSPGSSAEMGPAALAISGTDELQLAQTVPDVTASLAAIEPSPENPARVPYPERHDPFRRPDPAKMSPSKSEEFQGASTVALKGFARTDTTRVLLSIDGKLTAIQAGERRGEIQVIAIAPPQVVLQRGRTRWTESLRDAP